MSIFVSDQVHSQTKVAKTTRTTNAMEVSFAVLGEVEINNNIHGLNIDTSGEKVYKGRCKYKEDIDDVKYDGYLT